MIFLPHSKAALRLPSSDPKPGTPNVNVRYALDEAAWLWHSMTPPLSPTFLLFRLAFESDGGPIVLEVSADMRFELALDNVLVARGPDSGDPDHWSFSTLQLAPPAGAHVLQALVWWLPASEKLAGRMTWRGGFACAGRDQAKARFHTGFAAWEVAELQGWKSTGSWDWTYHVIGPGSVVDLRLFDGAAAEWGEPSRVRDPVNNNPHGLKAPGWSLSPSRLPELRHEIWRDATVRACYPHWLTDEAVYEEGRIEGAAAWEALWRENTPLVMPAGTAATVLVDYDDYLDGYPVIEFEGGEGAAISWLWSESLYVNSQHEKDNRDEISGNFFQGFGDTFIAGGRGRRVIRSHWWRAGRYALLRVNVAGETLILHSLAVERTGYPLEPKAHFACSDGTLEPVLALCQRGLLAGMNDVYVDSPFFEQMMYMGDTRLEVLMTYIVSPDDRLPRRCMDLISYSRDVFGLTAERYPSHDRQESATFTMFWIWMLHDHTFWRNDHAWVASHLPTVRGILDTLAAFENAHGLLDLPPGWLFMDWVPGWEEGSPPSSRRGVSALVNFQYLLTIQKAAELEDILGNPRLGITHREHAERLQARLNREFWDGGKGLFADDASRKHWSQHAQILALLSGTCDPDPKASWGDPGAASGELALATVYFKHYLLEALYEMGRGDWILQSLDFWRNLVRLGLKCPVEQPEPSRSDCHAWGSHPLFHVHASLAGIRPAAPGFSHVRIAPRPGNLSWIESEVCHPCGIIRFHGEFSGPLLQANIQLPRETSGTLVWGESEIPLHPGSQTIQIPQICS